jgi:hypothetical protein
MVFIFRPKGKIAERLVFQGLPKPQNPQILPEMIVFRHKVVFAGRNLWQAATF